MLNTLFKLSGKMDQKTLETQAIVEKHEKSESQSFSFTVSNPPYQKMDNGPNPASVAIYHHYMNMAKEYSDKISMIYPTRWVQGGRGSGIAQFRSNELKSTKYSSYYDYSNSMDIFPEVDIKGGINLFLWNREKTKPIVKCFYNGKPIIKASISEKEIYVRDPGFSSMVDKVLTVLKTSKSLSEIIEPRGFYGEKISNKSRIEALPEEILNKVKAYYVIKGKGVYSRNLSIDNVRNNVIVNDWKVFASKTTSLQLNKTYPRTDRIFIGEPDSVSSDSFLKIGSFNSEAEAINCLRYIKTEFCSMLFALITPAQNSTKSNYKLIPNVDFKTGEIKINNNETAFIDFGRPETLDNQLAEIFNLTEKEKQLLKSDIKPWRNRIDPLGDK